MSESTDKIHNGDFSVAEGTLPQGWTVHKHPINPNLTPTFKLRINKDHQKPELVAYNQQRECYGYVYQTCTLDAGDYVFQVELTIHNMQDLNRHVVSAIFDDEAPTAFNTGIVEYRNENGVAKGEVRFHCDKQRRVQIRLYFRYSPEIHAEVHWRRVSLRKLEVPIAKRCVTIVCADLKADSSKPALDSPPGYDKWLKHWGDRLNKDVAKQWREKTPDAPVIVVLPEFFDGNLFPTTALPALNKAFWDLIESKAKDLDIMICGALYEKRSDFVYNTARLFFGKSGCVGVYDKNFLFDHELDDGATPGTSSPVFPTTLGRIGIMTCYDSWFPEMARTLALKGAEMVLFPNQGYLGSLMPARAADNGVWVAASSHSDSPGVWGPNGDSVSGASGTKEKPWLVVNIDLTKNDPPAYYGGPFASAPGGRRPRDTRMLSLYDELAIEARRWGSS